MAFLDSLRRSAFRCRRTAVLVVSLAMLSSIFLAMPVSAATTPSPDPGTLQTQLDQALAKLTQINDQLQQAQTSLDTLNRELAADQQREKQLQQQVADLARLEYEQPVFNLTTLLTARSISQILGSMAQARLVSGRQQDLLSQASQVRQHQQQLRDSADGQLSQIKSARDQAAQIAAQALSSRNAALQSVATQAAAVACDPNGSGPNSCPSGSIQQIITGAFAPQGQAAVTWGLRIAKCESGYNPRAVNPSGATGLFQFMPSTFANTPPGKAGGSIWDPVAQSQAAAWMYSQGRQGEWQCN